MIEIPDTLMAVLAVACITAFLVWLLSKAQR
jgi:hypothetical protein